MRGRFIYQAVLEILLICQFSAYLAAETSDANDSGKYLNAVRTFADNVLKHGKDTYGPKHTPLFVDGLNIHTHEPVKWISPKGDVLTATETEEWILSNFASQQTLLRTLDGLSTLTGDQKYREAAMQAIKYAFEHLQAPNGLFYWGQITAYDALGDTPCGDTSRESIKLHYPYYELMWEVDPDATKKLIESLWCSHVMDWSNLDFNRIGITTANLEEPWNHEYKADPVFFESKHGGCGFFVTASSLIQAGTTLYNLSRQEQSLVWSKRLAHRYVQTRHPETGIASKMYNGVWPPLGEDLEENFRDPRTRVFPMLVFEETRYIYYPELIATSHPWLSFVLTGDTLGEPGREFTQWAIEELTAWGKMSYRKEDNSFVPILTNGTNIEGYVSKQVSIYAPKGAIAKPLFADLTFFWAYAAAYRATGNEFMWEMLRDIGIGNSLGDIGRSPMDTPKLQMDTTCSDVYGLLGFLSLYEKTSKPLFLKMSQRIGDNILNKQFHKGFFVPSNKHTYTRFDCSESLALLHLHTAIRSKIGFVPKVWPSYPLFVWPYRHKQEGVDRRIIYTLTGSLEPPLSLQEAAAIGNIDLVRSLIEKGVGVDSWDDSKLKTALQCAAMNGHRGVVLFLLAKCARVDAQEDFPGGTALDYAAEKGHRAIAELLIAHGADVNATRGYPAGDAPLHSAARAGHKDIIELLISNGADINAKNNNGQTPVDIAISRNRKDIVKLLIANGVDVSFHTAIRLGDLAIVKSLIDKGADINAKDASGRTVLHYAVEGGHKDIVELLIVNGANVNAKDKDGNTPAHIALGENKGSMLGLLIEKGANLDSIHLAAYKGDLDKVRSFIEKGADVNAKDSYGATPLHYAAVRGSKEVVEFLVAGCADVNVKKKSGDTPLHWAAMSGNKDVVELLIDNAADVNARGRWHYTPIYYAAWSGVAEVVELLVEEGADVDVKDEWGWTPLHYMAQHDYYRDMAEFLIVKGADVNVKGDEGETPLSVAKNKDHTEIVDILLKHGAKE